MNTFFSPAAIHHGKSESVLELVETVAIPATPKFDPEAHFFAMSLEERERSEASIGVIGIQPITANLLEPASSAITLHVHRLRIRSTDDAIVCELGGEGVALTFAQMWELVKKQGHGQQGILLINGLGNTFYVSNPKGGIWAVRCYWCPSYQYWSVQGYYPNSSVSQCSYVFSRWLPRIVVF